MSYLTMPAALASQERVTGRFSRLLRAASEGTRKVPHLTWTIGETGAHVLGGLRIYPEMLAGTATGWESLTAGEAENARLLADVPEREPHEIADAIDTAAAKLREAFGHYSKDLAPWHAGLRIPPAAMVGLLVGDMLVHGWDIATVLGHTWVIDPPDAFLAFSATMPVMEHFVDEEAARGFSATYGIQLRRGPAFTLTFADGRLTTDEGRPPHADCRMSVEAVAYLLSAYGRVSLWRPVIRGSLISYGRRPWLGLKLTSLLRNP
jgi:Mycothiol maleylpyruvate isomerase N-terminal domain